MSSKLAEALRQTRAKHQRLLAFHQGLVEVFEAAIAKADALAQEFEQDSSKEIGEDDIGTTRRRSQSPSPRS